MYRMNLRKILVDESCWCQDWKTAGKKTCLLMAFSRMYPTWDGLAHTPEYLRLLAAVKKRGGHLVSEWNDLPTTTFADVCEVIYEAGLDKE